MTSGRPTTNIVAVPRNLLLLFRFAYYSPITLCRITSLRSLTPTPLSNPPPLNILYTFDYIGHIPPPLICTQFISTSSDPPSVTTDDRTTNQTKNLQWSSSIQTQTRSPVHGVLVLMPLIRISQWPDQNSKSTCKQCVKGESRRQPRVRH